MPLFLSRLQLNPYRREVQRDLADCYALHRRLLSAFPQAPDTGKARDCFGMLYRVESQHDQAAIILQSAMEPDWLRLPGGYLRQSAEVKPVDALFAQIRSGMTLRFRLVANPTRRISAGNTQEAERWHGKRVAISGEAQQLAWLARKGEQCGFILLPVQAASVNDVRVLPQAESGGQRQGKRITLQTVRFDGRLRVTDADRLRQALQDGIGSGKAFGMGLLSIAPDSGRV